MLEHVAPVTVSRSDNRLPEVHIVGRSANVDRVTRRIKEGSPTWLLDGVRVMLSPWRRIASRLTAMRRLRVALPASRRAAFRRLHTDALGHWREGGSVATQTIKLPVPGSNYSVSIRARTSDVLLYQEIMINEQYGRAPIDNVAVIVDCGANVGLASAYLLAHHPASRVIALEPDSVNHAMCSQNMRQFGNRATVRRAALWGSPAALRMSDELRGTWAAQVTLADASEGGDPIAVVTMQTLMADYSLHQIDLLKIDIEGAELAVFAAPDRAWLDRVRCIQIELETEQSRTTFFAALRGRPFNFSQYRETVIALRTGSLLSGV